MVDIKEKNMKQDKVTLTCEKHNLEYEGRYIPLIDIYTECPKCAEERKERLRQEQEAERLKEERKEREYYERYIKNFSNIPLRYIDFNFDIETSNVKQYAKILEEPLNKNLFITGNTGVGKTAFMCKVLINNAKRIPYYLDGNELSLMSNKTFAISGILEKIEGKGIIAIDEVQQLILNGKNGIFDYIINKAYNQKSNIILCGNLSEDISKTLAKDEWKRSAGRFKQDGVIVINVKGKDLRNGL